MYDDIIRKLNSCSSGHSNSLNDLINAQLSDDYVAMIDESNWIASHINLKRVLTPTNLSQIKSWLKDNGTSAEGMPDLEYGASSLREAADRHGYDLKVLGDKIDRLSEHGEAERIVKKMLQRRTESLIDSATIAASVLNGEANSEADIETSELFLKKHTRLMSDLDVLSLVADNMIRYIEASYSEIDGWMQHVNVDAEKMRSYLNDIVHEYQIEDVIKTSVGVVYDNVPIDVWMETSGKFQVVVNPQFKMNAVQAFLIALGDIECETFDRLNYGEIAKGVPLVDQEMLYAGHMLHYVAQAQRKLCGHSYAALSAALSVKAAAEAKAGATFQEVMRSAASLLWDKFNFSSYAAIDEGLKIATNVYAGCRQIGSDRAATDFVNPMALTSLAGYRLAQELADAGMFRFLTLGMSSIDDILDVVSCYNVNVGDLPFKKRGVAEELAKKLT